MGPFMLALLLATSAPQVADSLRQAAASQPLFLSREPLELRIEAPLTTIFKERGAESEEFPGKLIHVDGAGAERTLDVGLRTRGKARLRKDICEFPPIRIDFDREDVAASVFAGQNRLKLVTHCQSGRAESEQYVLQEYLVYQLLGLFTDLSFRARLARVTYVDTDGKQDTLTRTAFLIEEQGLMAARNGWSMLTVQLVPPDAVDPDYLALVEVFEYLIGNPDWSAFQRAPDEDECCHNTQPIGNAQVGPVFPVPYDFDITGIVYPRYADRVFMPADRNLGIRTVRDRAYRGLCQSRERVPGVLALFDQKKDAVYALYRGASGLDADALKKTLEYLDQFYRTIDDPKRVEQEITRKCR
jgi:hypothetical protein